MSKNSKKMMDLVNAWWFGLDAEGQSAVVRYSVKHNIEGARNMYRMFHKSIR